ncbi:MAG: alpha-glucan family phosphorylase [Verrucomicrobia bacterium]|nr:alpha-glucan family phosphorylase [Verrucomicrobiota bacterium]MDA1339763.1 alpha-glucan family phosphorylase [Verrucomicrobiota bacterium]
MPRVPEGLESLRNIAFNLWWSWNYDALELFCELDAELWETCGHSPIKMLRLVKQNRLEAAAKDKGYRERVEKVHDRLEAYLHRKETWFTRNLPKEKKDSPLVAYFSAEFGFHESLPNYSGGLGILAGDHCKSASDLGLPFVAVGLLYRFGYFSQKINRDGWQEASAIDNVFQDLPIREALASDGKTPVVVELAMPGRAVRAKAWEVRIGLTRLILMDTDLTENAPEDRRITYQLYGGDHEMRIQQEIVLGIGGVRALAAMGLQPSVFHMNEGHAAFLGLERIHRLVKEAKLSFVEALQSVAASSVFTTHTPVPAGNDAFSPKLMEKYFGSYVAECQIGFQDLLKLGRPWEYNEDEPFSMTILALRISRQANGVSAIHGKVSRGMWQSVWPGVPKTEIPIRHVTNGIHTFTWMAPEIRALLEKAGGVMTEEDLAKAEEWKKRVAFKDKEYWTTHQKMKLRLLQFVRANVRTQRLRNGARPAEIRETDQMLDPKALTIGFARRFATYKRAALLFRDLDKLAQIVNDPARPVQFLFAGKSHPADEGGKKLIQQIVQISQLPQFKDRIVFVENYDFNVARHLYHGCDVWLNNPTRPLEASGTSGEKVITSGCLNFSVRDGWWDEAFDGTNGWAIGDDTFRLEPEVQDEFDSFSIYEILKHEIVPLYYDQDGDGVPKRWIERVRRSLLTIGPVYNTSRMVADYAGEFYRRAAEKGRMFAESGWKKSKELAVWKDKVRLAWGKVRANAVTWNGSIRTTMNVGDTVPVTANVFLGDLQAEEVAVEAYLKAVEPGGTSKVVRLEPQGEVKDGWQGYGGRVSVEDSGNFKFNVRIRPSHPSLTQAHELRLIAWAE